MVYLHEVVGGVAVMESYIESKGGLAPSREIDDEHRNGECKNPL